MKLFIITKKQLMLAICIVVAATILVVGSITISADQNRLLPIYCVETDKKQVAISFDALGVTVKRHETPQTRIITGFMPIPF